MYEKLIIILIITIIPFSETASIVNCNNNGQCTVTTFKNNTYTIQPKQVPKENFATNIQQTKTPSINNIQWTAIRLPYGISISGLLPGSASYECADGFNECKNGCCNKGQCSEALYVCITDFNYVKLIILIVGLAFTVIYLIYFTIHICLGCGYNSLVGQGDIMINSKFKINTINYNTAKDEANNHHQYDPLNNGDLYSPHLNDSKNKIIINNEKTQSKRELVDVAYDKGEIKENVLIEHKQYETDENEEKIPISVHPNKKPQSESKKEIKIVKNEHADEIYHHEANTEIEKQIDNIQMNVVDLNSNQNFFNVKQVNKKDDDDF